MSLELELLNSSPETIVGNAEQRLLVEWPSKVITVTGTIGSGKSTVLSELQARGAYVVSADELVHRLYAPHSPLLPELVKLFGSEAIKTDGSVNREFIGKLVFSDPVRKALLEQLTHPLVHQLASELFSDALKADRKFLVYEMPILFENGFDTLGFKKIVTVSADEECCVQRIVSRSGGKVIVEAARLRISAQLPATAKAARSDIVIDNSGSLEELRRQISEKFQGLEGFSAETK